MADTRAAVVPPEVSHDMLPVVLKAAIDDVYEGSAVALIAKRDRIAAPAFADAQKVDFEVICHY